MTDTYIDEAAQTAAGFAESRIPLTSACPRCGFALWNPIAALRVSSLGLYDDGRFPGRCLLRLDKHYDELLDLPADITEAFMADLHDVRDVIKEATGARHLNYAVLGNAERHVHWHVIPRRPAHEPLPSRSPWQDTRPQKSLPKAVKSRLMSEIAAGLNHVSTDGSTSTHRTVHR